MAEGGGARRGRPQPLGRWNPPGEPDLAPALEHLPAPCAGRVVRDGGAATAPGALPTGAIRRRCRDGLRGPRVRLENAGRAGQAPRSVRAHAPPDQDALRELPAHPSWGWE